LHRICDVATSQSAAVQCPAINRSGCFGSLAPDLCLSPRLILRLTLGYLTGSTGQQYVGQTIGLAKHIQASENPQNPGCISFKNGNDIIAQFGEQIRHLPTVPRHAQAIGEPFNCRRSILDAADQNGESNGQVRIQLCGNIQRP